MTTTVDRFFGTWVERLECVAASRTLVATAGRRDVTDPAAITGVSVFPPVFDGKNIIRRIPTYGAVYAVAFAGEGVVLVGQDDGTLVAYEIENRKLIADVALGGGSIRAIAVDADVARGDRGRVCLGTADGKVAVVDVGFTGGGVTFSIAQTHAVSDGAIGAVAWDPAGLWLAGGADGQLRVIAGADVRTVSPGGEGGIRAIASVGDGRALIGCGDGGVRACYVVGAVEATDRSGDHGHDGSIRGLALGPVVLDDAGREQARRFYTVGDDRALKIWLLDGARRPRTIESVVASPATGLVFAPGAVPGVEGAAGRLWISATQRTLAAVVVRADGDIAEGKPFVAEAYFEYYRHLLTDVQTATSRSAAGVKVKLDLIGQLEALAEDTARELLDGVLGNAQQPTEVLVAAAGAMARSKRRQSRPALRKAMASPVAEVRAAAFAALLALEAGTEIAAIRDAMAIAHDDVRIAALAAAVPLGERSVVARGVITDALKDRSHAVRRRAFAALRSVMDVRAAVKTALAHGIPDIRGEALLYLGFVERTVDAPTRALAIGAFDDPDAGVRSSAFLAAVAQRRTLAARLAAASPAVAQAFAQVTAQLSIGIALPAVGPEATIEPLADEELEPLFVALACRNPDAANRGAGGLVALRDPRAIGAVLQLTREADPALRRGATANVVAALARWPGDDRLVTRLQWLLDDADPTVRAYAFDALARTMGDLDLSELALRTSHPDIRVRALQILVKLGSSAEADALLADALDDEAVKVRVEAWRTEWAWHAQDPMLVLRRGRASRHGDIRQMVVTEVDRRRAGKQATPDMLAVAFDLLADPVAAVGTAAYTALTRQLDPKAPVAIDPAIFVAAMGSPSAAVRATGASGVATEKPPAAPVRARLLELVKDENPAVHTAAIEALDAVAPADGEGFALAFASVFWGLQVRATELCGKRRDKRAVAPATRILTYAKSDVNRPPDEIRWRAADALAQVGDLDSVKFLASLVDGDDDRIVKEHAARGIATAAVRGNEMALRALVALLGHENLAVRSWGGEGLAKLGDLRALPVLAGTQQHEHRPLRIGAIVGFVALGPDGVRGLRQGLEDPDREIRELAFAVIVARDTALAAANIAPDLLVDAMSSPSPEIRFAAARLYERRVAGEELAAATLGELVGPRKATDAEMKDWPLVARRAALLQVVADAIASDDSQQRYAATQVVALRAQPLAFWREAGRLAGPAGRAAAAAHTGWNAEARVSRRAGWLRRLVADRRDPEASELENLARVFLRAGRGVDVDLGAAQRLVFGVYAGLVRQAPRPGEADETHRVRRDAVARLADLAREEAVGADAVLPVLGHAVSDPNHLVRGAAMTALRSLYPVGALGPLAQAIGGAADLGKAAIDELVEIALAGDDRAAALVRGALDADDEDVRAYAAEKLPRLYPAGSTEPQLLAAQSKHGDVRLAAIGELASAGGGGTPSQAVIDALISALASEHADLKLAAATGLAKLGNPLGVEVLGAFLRDDDNQWQAKDALETVAQKPEIKAAAAAAVAKALEDDVENDLDRDDMYELLESIGHPAGIPIIVKALVQVEPGKEGDVEDFIDRALDAITAMLHDPAAKQRARQLPDGRTRQKYDDALALGVIGELARSPVADVRKRAARMLGDIDDRAVEDVLAKLLGDRSSDVRVAAAEALALRAEYVPNATLAALEAALRGGRRELVLPAAMGLAARKRPEAFQPLLLVAKAGEPEEQEQAIVAVGGLGDARALDHVVPLLTPEPGDELGKRLMPFAVEALGKLLPALEGDVAQDMREKVEQYAASGATDVREHALTGLRYGGGERGRALLERIAADADEVDDVRAHAVRQLGLLADPASEPVLAELIGSDEYDVQEAAVEALMKVVGRDPMRFSLHALVVEDSDTSEKAAKFLAREGDPALLVDRLGEVKNAEVRKMLVEGLIRRKQAPVAALETAIAAPAAPVRAAAAWVAGAVGGALGPAAIAQAVARGAAGVAATAAPGSGGDREDEVDAYLAALWIARRANQAGAATASAARVLGDRRAPVGLRVEAARVLADAGDRGALAGAIEDGEREVRVIAARAMAGAADAAARVEALGSRADATTVAPAALGVWTAVGKKLIADEGSRTWALAVSVAGKTVGELVAIAKDRASGARLDAIAALGLVGGDAALAALEAIHGDDGEADDVKKAAWRALKRIVNGRPKTYAPGQDKGKGGPSGGASGEVEDGEDGEDGEDDEGGGASTSSDGGDGDDDDGGDDDSDGADDSDDDDDGADDSDDDDGDDDDDDGDDDGDDEEDDE